MGYQLQLRFVVCGEFGYDVKILVFEQRERRLVELPGPSVPLLLDRLNLWLKHWVGVNSLIQVRLAPGKRSDYVLLPLVKRGAHHHWLLLLDLERIVHHWDLRNVDVVPLLSVLKILGVGVVEDVLASYVLRLW